MTFFSIKCAFISITLGAAIAACGYLLATASYVGNTSHLVLAPKVTDSGTMWIAENEEIAVEVRYITSLIETPSIAIHRKQQSHKLAVALLCGCLTQYACYRLMMRKAPVSAPVAPTALTQETSMSQDSESQTTTPT